ncbi:hypothetical protein SASPL_118097 [Salvia splendens]|uniref:Uncharacterized protein n=1 Tax=Salvia splendens TaxID=180675 RepID=A0A8X8ZYT9_SALSN|nr:hypothetical protein SASPL_118097 [Salvia splendens]
MKTSATPHPIKNGGNTKRSACVPLTETGRVRKKIVFEFDELIAGTNGGGSAIAGKDGWSSLPGERDKGRWKRKARPGPFEASTGAFEVVPGVLPLLAGELRFSMGQKDGSARHQPEVVTGTRLEGALPEVNEAVAQGVLRSTRVEAAASAAVLDEDTSSERYGANMLFDPPTLAAPFPEKDRHVLASETCDSLMGQSLLQFKSGDGTNFKAEDNNGGGEAGLNGKPSAPDNPSDPPDKLLDQDRDQPEILPKHSASEVGIDVASPVGSPPTLGHSLEFITDKAAQAETQPVEPDLGEKPANTGAGLDSGGPPKSDAVNLDADHDTEMGTFGWCEGIPSLTFSNEETKCLVDKLLLLSKILHPTVPPLTSAANLPPPPRHPTILADPSHHSLVHRFITFFILLGGYHPAVLLPIPLRLSPPVHPDENHFNVELGSRLPSTSTPRLGYTLSKPARLAETMGQPPDPDEKRDTPALNPDHLPDIVPGDEEARVLSDQQMVFRAGEAASLQRWRTPTCLIRRKRKWSIGMNVKKSSMPPTVEPCRKKAARQKLLLPPSSL